MSGGASADTEYPHLVVQNVEESPTRAKDALLELVRMHPGSFGPVSSEFLNKYSFIICLRGAPAAAAHTVLIMCPKGAYSKTGIVDPTYSKRGTQAAFYPFYKYIELLL